MRRHPATEATAAAEATRRRLRSRFLRPRRMVEKQCTFWLYTKCSIYVHCTHYIYGCYMVYICMDLDGSKPYMVCLQGPMTNLARVSVFCPSSFFSSLSPSLLTYLVEHAVMFSYFARYYINTQAEVPPLLAVSKSSYKRAGLVQSCTYQFG